MGVGKSTVGPLVAARLGAAFVDLDALIEERSGRSIVELFAEEGEAAFRAPSSRRWSRSAAGLGSSCRSAAGRFTRSAVG